MVFAVVSGYIISVNSGEGFGISDVDEGYLSVGYMSEKPVVQYRELLYYRDGQKTVVDKLTLLEGLVVIDTAAEAAQYVRAFTSPRYAPYIDFRLGVEVRGFSEIPWDWLPVGLPKTSREVRSGRAINGLFGVLNSTASSWLVEKPLRVRALPGNSFEVKSLGIHRNPRNRTWEAWDNTYIVSARGRCRLVTISRDWAGDGVKQAVFLFPDF